MQTLDRQRLNTILNNFVVECKTTFGDNLCGVRLFGSYARGDDNEDSDIDIMVILDINDDARKNRNDICRIAAILELKYHISISPVLYSKEEYDIRKVFGFCRNVEKEGVNQYVRQAYV
ncbi:MAG: nucleotidyltransferase domain-containing protein [Oscillospiraceae bacterium]|jgi:predicted nucleotidyltransferase|nr:nucleotidyltransferase domain-containing protein [Oscillospiraceae bacterium]